VLVRQGAQASLVQHWRWRSQVVKGRCVIIVEVGRMWGLSVRNKPRICAVGVSASEAQNSYTGLGGAVGRRLDVADPAG